MRPADTLTIFFSAFLFALTAVNFNAIPLAGNLLLIYASIIIFQALLIPLSRINSFLSLTRDIIFPVVSVLIIFDSLGPIVHRINPHDMDYLLIQIDYLMFGTYPTAALERMIHPLITDILQLAYTSYYFLPVSLGIALKVRKKEEDLERTVFIILLCFYLSYIGYMLVPALGPRFTIHHLQTRDLEGFLIAQPIQNALNLLEGVKRDAFPSGHTGIALTVLCLAFRYARDLFRWMAVPVGLLIIATVYCRYHYAVDVAAGVLLTVVTIALGEVYYKFRRKDSEKF